MTTEVTREQLIKTVQQLTCVISKLTHDGETLLARGNDNWLLFEAQTKIVAALRCKFSEADSKLAAALEVIAKAEHSPDCQFEIAKRCDEWLLAQMKGRTQCNCWISRALAALDAPKESGM